MKRSKLVWIFVLAILYHVGIGIMLLFAPSAEEAGALYGLAQIIPDHVILGVALIVVSLLAILAMVWDQKPWRFGLGIIPQQAALTASAFGSIYLVWIRSYTTTDLHAAFVHMGFHGAHLHLLLAVFGPQLHKLTDWRLLFVSQWISICAAIAHTGAIVNHYRVTTWRTGA